MSSNRNHMSLPTKVVKDRSAVNVNNPEGKRWSPNATAKWEQQSVHSWIESLASATEVGEEKQYGTRKSLSVDDVALSRPTPDIVDGLGLASLNMKADEGFRPNAGSALCFETDDGFRPNIISSLYHKEDVEYMFPFSMPEKWDLAFLAQDRNPHSAFYIRQIGSLGIRIESFPPPVLAVIEGKYKELQKRFLIKYFNIDLDNSLSFEKREKNLLSLYDNTVYELKQIISDGKDAREARVRPSSARSSSTAPVVKKDLSKYMTEWLRENWIYPYPDDELLTEMAKQCGTTKTVVSNWLINARTRKWRPAIIQANELGRPAGCLFKNSLAIFDGKSVSDDENDVGERFEKVDVPHAALHTKKGRHSKRIKIEEV